MDLASLENKADEDFTGHIFQEAEGDGISTKPNAREVEGRRRTGDARWRTCWSWSTRTETMN
jgi:hypothetical protein